MVLHTAIRLQHYISPDLRSVYSLELKKAAEINLGNSKLTERKPWNNV